MLRNRQRVFIYLILIALIAALWTIVTRLKHAQSVYNDKDDRLNPGVDPEYDGLEEISLYESNNRTYHSKDGMFTHRYAPPEHDPPWSEYYESASNDRKPVVTMFTIMDDRVDHVQRNINTMRNWDALYPDVRPVLFISPADRSSRGTHRERSGYSLVNLLKNVTRHWMYLRTPHLMQGRPTLQGMFQAVQLAGHNTSLVGYVDSGVIFDTSLVDTLDSLVQHISSNPTKKVMITGHSQRLQRSMGATPASCLRCITRLSGSTRPIFDRQDYFFVSHAGFPWDKCPQFMVGVGDFDHRVLWLAMVNGVTVIDATITVYSVSQSVENTRQYVYNQFPLENLGVKTWPGHLPCPKAIPHKCLPIKSIVT